MTRTLSTNSPYSGKKWAVTLQYSLKEITEYSSRKKWSDSKSLGLEGHTHTHTQTWWRLLQKERSMLVIYFKIWARRLPNVLVCVLAGGSFIFSAPHLSLYIDKSMMLKMTVIQRRLKKKSPKKGAIKRWSDRGRYKNRNVVMGGSVTQCRGLSSPLWQKLSLPHFHTSERHSTAPHHSLHLPSTSHGSNTSKIMGKL